MVPHWVRGVETAELTQFSDKPPAPRKNRALRPGGSVATPPEGIDADTRLRARF